MCPGGNPTDRLEFSRISSAAIRDARRALPAYTENQPKSAHLSPQRGVFDFSIFNYVVLTTEFSANSPNSPSRRARQHRNLKFRCFNNVIYFAKRKYTHIFGGAVSGRDARTYTVICRNSRRADRAPSRRRSRQRRPRLQAYQITFDSALVSHTRPPSQRKHVFPRAVKLRTTQTAHRLRRYAPRTPRRRKSKKYSSAPDTILPAEVLRARDCDAPAQPRQPVPVRQGHRPPPNSFRAARVRI